MPERLRCPACRSRLAQPVGAMVRCSVCGEVYDPAKRTRYPRRPHRKTDRKRVPKTEE